MRVWLDPEAMRIRSISPAEIYQAIQSQNMEVSAGTVGQPIGKNTNAFSQFDWVKGRSTSPDEFGVFFGDGGKMSGPRCWRIDLGSASYNVVSQLRGKPTVAIAIYQQPGSNSLDVRKVE